MLYNGLICTVYDIEVFPNFFCITYLNTESSEVKTLQISPNYNQIEQIKQLFKQNHYFVGYNNLNYDGKIIHYLTNKRNIHNKELKFISDEVINNPDATKFYDLYPKFKQLDLMKILFPNKLQSSLKWLEIVSHFDKCLEYTAKFNKPVRKSQHTKVIQYCENDVKATAKILELAKDKLTLRAETTTRYKVNVSNMDDVTVGESILLAKLREKGIHNPTNPDLDKKWGKAKIKTLLVHDYSFINPKTTDWFNKFKELSIDLANPDINEVIKHYKIPLSIRAGGIHSLNKPSFYKQTDNTSYIDIDVASMYPMIIENYNLFPDYIKDALHQIYHDLRIERIEAKQANNKSVAEQLKLALNGISGKLGQEGSWLYYPPGVLKLRINGQLILLELIDKLAALNVDTIMANTDGITIQYNNELKSILLSTIEEHQSIYNIQFENVEYDQIYIESVSSYLAKTKSGKIKEKATFISKPEISKSLRPKIIAKALKAYFIDNIPVKEFYSTQDDIKDYLIAQKISSKFKVFYGNHEVQQLNRFYVSTKGKLLYKVNKDTNRLINIHSNPVRILNDLKRKPKNLDKNWYIYKTLEIINNIKPIFKQLDLFYDI